MSQRKKVCTYICIFLLPFSVIFAPSILHSDILIIVWGIIVAVTTSYLVFYAASTYTPAAIRQRQLQLFDANNPKVLFALLVILFFCATLLYFGRGDVLNTIMQILAPR